MSLKAKILLSLKTKYKSLGLSDKTLGEVAAMLDATITEEENIETAVAGVENLLKGFQSDADARVTAAVNKAKQPEPVNVDPAKPEGGVSGNEPAAQTPATTDIAAIINAALAPIVKDIANIKAGNTAKSRKQVLEEKLKDVNPTIKSKILKDFDRMSINSDDDFNAYVEETIADVGELSKVITETDLGAGTRPSVGVVPTGSVKEATKEELDAAMSNLNI